MDTFNRVSDSHGFDEDHGQSADAVLKSLEESIAAQNCQGCGCSEVQAILYQYVDGELTDDVQSVLNEHIKQCASCQEDIHAEKKMRTIVRKSCSSYEIPQDLSVKISSALKKSIHIDSRGSVSTIQSEQHTIEYSDKQ